MSKYKEIYLVEILSRPMIYLAPKMIPYQPEDIIAVFRRYQGDEKPGPLYRPYQQRSGLRHRRLLRIIGRHG